MKIKNNIIASLSIRELIYVGLILGAILVGYISLKFGPLYGMIYAMIPMSLLFITYSLKTPQLTFIICFIVNYFLIGLARYIPGFPSGVALDTLLFITFASILIRSCYTNVEWRNAISGLSIVAIIWFLYCLFELFNPMAITMAWAKSIRGIATYFVVISLFVPLIFTKYIYVKRIVLILSILTLLAVAKAVGQKYLGFDIFELRWLYISGGASTHIIHSGTRYFSFYSDAGNYGAAMGFAMVLFSLIAFYVKNKYIRYYLLFVAFAALIGMLLSGTRGALAIPFVGYTLFVILSKKIKLIVVGLVIITAAFLFLKFSTVGNGNEYIRRSRSALNFNDASLQVRIKNQQKLSVIMKDLPFGTGIGLGGGKAKEFAPTRPISQIPTDSWFVLIWVETGMVGLILYLLIQLYILLHGCYLVLFRLKNRRLRGIIAAMVCGTAGMLVASYGNEIWGQLPNIFVLTVCQAFIFLSPKYDKELESNEYSNY